MKDRPEWWLKALGFEDEMKELILTKKLTFGSLFSGIGGLDLGLERAGMECRWQVEIDPFCQKVLAKHWPNVKRYGDIKNVDGRELEPVDLICGGFPCQDLSSAGKLAGIDGERSGLWSEYARLLRHLRPRLVLIENVPGLLANKPMRRVLGDLSILRYDAEWSPVSACSMGESHMRRRVFIVAHANGLDGRPRVWDFKQRGQWEISTVDNFESARANKRARLANPSELYRGADGIPDGMDRNRAIGNSVYPDCAEWIGRKIISSLTGAPLPAYPVLEGGGLRIHRAETTKSGKGASSPDPVLRTQGSEF